MVYEAESLESARAIVEADAFYSGGVVSRGSTLWSMGNHLRATCSGTRSGCSCTRCLTSSAVVEGVWTLISMVRGGKCVPTCMCCPRGFNNLSDVHIPLHPDACPLGPPCARHTYHLERDGSKEPRCHLT